MARKRTPAETETNVLEKSGRRCCLCFALANDFTEKQGQIAHIDQNPANNSEDNLAWLCLLHHSLYDSQTSQHKNYSAAEVKRYRARLYAEWEKIRRGRAGHPLTFIEVTMANGHIVHVANSNNIAAITDHDGQSLHVVEFETPLPDNRYTVLPIGSTSRNFKISQATRNSFAIEFDNPVGDYFALKIEPLDG